MVNAALGSEAAGLAMESLSQIGCIAISNGVYLFRRHAHGVTFNLTLPSSAASLRLLSQMYSTILYLGFFL